MRLPVAVASTGPTTTLRPVASAVRVLRYLSWQPPPTMWIVEKLRPVMEESFSMVSAYASASDFYTHCTMAPMVRGRSPARSAASSTSAIIDSGFMKRASSTLTTAW